MRGFLIGGVILCLIFILYQLDFNLVQIFGSVVFIYAYTKINHINTYSGGRPRHVYIQGPHNHSQNATNSVQKSKFKEHLTNMYKCTNLHAHFSGYVSSVEILRNIHECDWNFNGTEIVFGKGTKDSIAVEKYIEDSWETHDFEKSATNIGKLFFNCIKTPKLYQLYLESIEKQMAKENIDHLELRLELGSVKEWSMNDEIKKLSEFIEEMLKRGKSLIIIPQFSRHSSPKKFVEYFTNVSKIKSDYVKSFDLVGDEKKGDLTSEFDISRIYKLLGHPVLHAGEFDNDKSDKNMIETLKLYNAMDAQKYTRVGHGLNNKNWDKFPKTTIWEYCPSLYLYTGEKLKPELLNKEDVNFVIGSDDCNKIFDKNLSNNVVELWENGVEYFKILISFLYSIMVSYASDTFKRSMFDKWHDQYCTYYNYTDTSKNSNLTYYSVDADCKWYISTRKTDLIDKLEKITKTCMQVSLDILSKELINDLCEKLIHGMKLYSFKPNSNKTLTWTEEEYNLPEFQYTYIRLKSLQRYTECYSMFELVFTNIDNKELSKIKNVVSFGGGIGFEILALTDYLESRDIPKPATLVIDIVDSWGNYIKLLGIDKFEVGDFNNLTKNIITHLQNADLIIFSYVAKYIQQSFYDYVNRDLGKKILIFNERGIDIKQHIPKIKKVNRNIYTLCDKYTYSDNINLTFKD